MPKSSQARPPAPRTRPGEGRGQLQQPVVPEVQVSELAEVRAEGPRQLHQLIPAEVQCLQARRIADARRQHRELVPIPQVQ